MQFIFFFNEIIQPALLTFTIHSSIFTSSETGQNYTFFVANYDRGKLTFVEWKNIWGMLMTVARTDGDRI